jgi:hypothetical protein
MQKYPLCNTSGEMRWSGVAPNVYCLSDEYERGVKLLLRRSEKAKTDGLPLIFFSNDSEIAGGEPQAFDKTSVKLFLIRMQYFYRFINLRIIIGRSTGEFKFDVQPFSNLLSELF